MGSIIMKHTTGDIREKKCVGCLLQSDGRLIPYVDCLKHGKPSLQQTEQSADKPLGDCHGGHKNIDDAKNCDICLGYNYKEQSTDKPCTCGCHKNQAVFTKMICCDDPILNLNLKPTEEKCPSCKGRRTSGNQACLTCLGTGKKPLEEKCTCIGSMAVTMMGEKPYCVECHKERVMPEDRLPRCKCNKPVKAHDTVYEMDYCRECFNWIIPNVTQPDKCPHVWIKINENWALCNYCQAEMKIKPPEQEKCTCGGSAVYISRGKSYCMDCDKEKEHKGDWKKELYKLYTKDTDDWNYWKKEWGSIIESEIQKAIQKERERILDKTKMWDCYKQLKSIIKK